MRGGLPLDFSDVEAVFAAQGRTLTRDAVLHAIVSRGGCSYDRAQALLDRARAAGRIRFEPGGICAWCD